jgi:DNA repair protein RadC
MNGSQIPMFEDYLTIARKEHRKVNDLLAKMQSLSNEINQVISSDRSEAPIIQSPRDAADLLTYDMSCLNQEEMRVLLLNTRNRVMRVITIYRGSLNSSPVRVCEVFRPAILENAAAIILVHNHPSGDPTPSPDDVAVTRAIVQAGKLLDLEVLDHLVIAGGHYVSLKERGLGFS